ncbi:endonuclease VII domain-containing protein [Rhodococcus sp. DMU2021]|uniref:endonuclease VII domain-containing protein n=1 Tax=Rhodococcus sp. DMU2021 TaxID=2866997 RepID=UPI001C7DDE6C|nr:endonuclease VII domain-containing protein [Rhodococcus sp. DMU2021]
MSEDTSIRFQCIRCKEFLPRDGFYYRKDDKPDGSPSRRTCRSCQREVNRRWKTDGPQIRRWHQYDNPDGTRTCRVCKVPKNLDEFKIRNKETGLRRNECFDCHKQLGKERYESDKKSHQDRMRRSRFGMEIGEYDRMMIEQNGVCAICGQPETSKHSGGATRKLFVDHDHQTGVVRQLLCMKCNAGIGQFQDSPQLLRNAIEYLERHGRI